MKKANPNAVRQLKWPAAAEDRPRYGPADNHL